MLLCLGFLIGSFTNGFDSFLMVCLFRKDVGYILAMSAAIIVALMIQHLAELSLRSLLLASLPAIAIFSLLSPLYAR